MAKQSQARRALELRYQFRFKVVDAAASTIQTLVPWGAAVAIAYFFYGGVVELSGKTTLADIGIRILGDFRINEALAWAITGGTGFLAYKERRLRRKTIERLTKQLKKYEEAFDSRRSSSKLTERGTTRPEDQL